MENLEKEKSILKDSMVIFRASELEKQRIQQQANRYGMTVSKYLRQLAVADEKAGLLEGPAFRFAQKEKGVIKWVVNLNR